MSFAMITVVNYKLTSTQLLHSCCQIVKGCLLDTRIPITWCMYPSTKRRASSDTLVPETDSMHPVIQLHFSIQLRIEPENDRRVSIIPGSHSALEFPCPKLLVRNKRYLIRHTVGLGSLLLRTENTSKVLANIYVVSMRYVTAQNSTV